MPDLELQVKVVNPDQVLTKDQLTKDQMEGDDWPAQELEAALDEVFADLLRPIYYGAANSARPAQDPNYGLARALPESSDGE